VKIKAVRSDVTDYDIGVQKWDAIVLIFAHTMEREALHERCINGLVPGGVIILEAYTPEQLQFKTGGPPDEARLVSASMLQNDFAGLVMIRLEQVERLVNEGVYHSGLGAVVQMIGRKPVYSEAAMAYRSEMDAIFEYYLDPDWKEQQHIGSHSKDRLLKSADLSNRMTVCNATKQKRCRYCWLPRQRCFCASIHSKSYSGIRFVVLCHPQEFLRSTSTGKLCSQLLEGELLLFGYPGHDNRLKQILESRCPILFPTEDSISVAELTTTDSSYVLLPDGTWKQAAAMLSVCKTTFSSMEEESSPEKSLRCVRLDPVTFDSRTSPIIEAVHPGFGQGRISTLEACLMFCKEKELWTSVEDVILDELNPMIQATRLARWKIQSNSIFNEDVSNAFQEIADHVVHRGDCTYCCICGVTLSTPLRLKHHLKGKRHCDLVASMIKDDASILKSEHLLKSNFEKYSARNIVSCDVATEPADTTLLKLLEMGF